MPARWEFADHTADVMLVAHGRDAAEALASAGAGLFDLMIGVEGVREASERRIEVAADDPAAMRVAWLNELLYVFEVAGLVFARFDVTLVDDGQRLVATGHGEPFDPDRQTVKLGVKAATEHQASLSPVDEGGEPGWRAQVILDV